jgi:hypothetical protein
MADNGRYELRMCDVPPAALGLEPAVPGVLYDGPHGPAYFDAAGDRIRVRGAIDVEYDVSLLEMSAAVKRDGLPLTAEGRRLLMRRRGRGTSRGARAIVVLDGDRELLAFRLRGWSAVSMERPDGTVVSRVPGVPPGAGTLVADVQAVEVGLLIAFCTSTMAIDLGFEVPHL